MADTINNMNDDLNQTTDAAHGTEPATKHDVTEGGVLGAVGGAVVGMLAGGPIGAVIGAVAGGVASAGAVGVVDKHDHDYDRTIGTDGTHNSITGLPTDGSSAGVVSAAPTSAYADTTNTGVIGTTTGNAEVIGTVPSAYNSNLSQNTGATAVNGETIIPIVEEELAVGKREVQSGGAHIRTGVIETPVEQSVNLHEEHVTVDRLRVDQPVSDLSAAFQEKSFEVTETAEVPVIAKSARVVEEVVVGKTATDRVETIHDTVRRTDVEVDELTTDDIKNR